MLSNGRKANCRFEEEIVSYIYDEMPAVERSKFERHLSGCALCTDEFAAVSDARFSMFEWQKEDFAHLPTPDIVIPYERSENAETTNGLFAGLRGLLSLVKVPLTAAAGLLLFVGLGFVVLQNVRQGDAPIASNIGQQPVQALTSVPIPKEEPIVTSAEVDEIATAKAKNDTRDVRQVKPVTHRRPATAGTAANIRKNPNLPSAPSTAPVLSAYEVSEDTSLRLADMFDDIDS